MFNPYKKESSSLEKFRIKAHLRRYVKDPIIIDEKLSNIAISKLKKLPYKEKDPADSVAIGLVIDAYKLGYYKKSDLTESGHQLLRPGNFHQKHQHLRKKRLNAYKKNKTFASEHASIRKLYFA